MKKIKILTSLLLGLSFLAHAGGVDDDPILTKVMGEIETRSTAGSNPKVWAVDAWVGKDLEKIWIKTEGEKLNGKITEAELQVLYSKATTPFWDLQYGIKKDFKPTPSRTWGVIAAKGLAPYLLEVDASLFVGESGRTAVRLDLEYEYMFSQKLVLSPEVEVNFFGKDDEVTGTGKGLSNIEAGLRLRYELSREFAPYVGVNWGKKYGNTATFANNEGEDVEDAQIVTGIRFWF
ncbi:copper resistance protein B [Candidatus Thioglobus sp.]|nr:copper resistance protein B [Candidatus Thioglobus sp.]